MAKISVLLCIFLAFPVFRNILGEVMGHGSLLMNAQDTRLFE